MQIKFVACFYAIICSSWFLEKKRRLWRNCKSVSFRTVRRILSALLVLVTSKLTGRRADHDVIHCYQAAGGYGSVTTALSRAPNNSSPVRQRVDSMVTSGKRSANLNDKRYQKFRTEIVHGITRIL